MAPSSSSSSLSSARQLLARGVGRLSDLVISRGSGSYVWDSSGKKFLDFTSGIGVTNAGHCHPKVVAAAQEQCARLIHSQANLSYHEPGLTLAQELAQIVPNGLDCFFFAVTGSEAVENAVKLARHATQKPNIIAFQGGYHGRTVGAMALTSSKTVYRAGFGPLMGGVAVSPFPYVRHCAPLLSSFTGKKEKREERDSLLQEWALTQLELVFKQQSAPSETAAVIMEPVLGEGGYVVPPLSFMKEVKRMCKERDVLLIADEVQTGFGRTGEYFACSSHFSTVPDILCMAKGLANGFPLSGIASRKELMDSQPPGSMGGTYSANPVACAAALATLKVLEEEKLLENAKKQGAKLRADLQKSADLFPEIVDEVRGLGLMVAVEFNPEKVSRGTAAAVSGACLKRGMLLLTTSAFETLRFIPPLSVSGEEVENAVGIVTDAMKEVFGEKKK